MRAQQNAIEFEKNRNHASSGMHAKPIRNITNVVFSKPSLIISLNKLITNLKVHLYNTQDYSNISINSLTFRKKKTWLKTVYLGRYMSKTIYTAHSNLESRSY